MLILTPALMIVTSHPYIHFFIHKLYRFPNIPNLATWNFGSIPISSDFYTDPNLDWQKNMLHDITMIFFC